MVKSHPYFTQGGEDRESNGDQYAANIQDGSWAGYKYFEFDGENEITVCIRGSAKGILNVSTVREGKPAAQIKIQATEQWGNYTAAIELPKGKQAIYFTFQGMGYMDFLSFTMRIWNN